MSPIFGMLPAVTPRKAPTGGGILYPLCSQWDCDDEEDWELITAADPDYPAVKRERDIAMYHLPRSQWRQRLQDERDKRSGGDPLWWGVPCHQTTPNDTLTQVLDSSEGA